MIRSIAAFTALACLAACSAPRYVVAHKSELFAQSWNSGLSKEEPPFQVQTIDKNTYAIRQSINSTFEAPFLYLIFGREKALLIDTGVEGAPLRPEVDRLIDAWLATNGQQAISLVVMHSHAHSDHVGGDKSFADAPAHWWLDTRRRTSPASSRSGTGRRRPPPSTSAAASSTSCPRPGITHRT